MRITFPLLILCAWGGLVLGAGACHASEISCISNYLPQLHTSFDDLDVRDGNNQAVFDSYAKDNLKELFQTSLLALVLEAEIHSFAQSLSILHKTLKHAVQNLVHSASAAVYDLVAALVPSRKHWDHAAAAIVALLIFSLAAVCVVHTNNSAPPVPAGAAFLVLRC